MKIFKIAFRLTLNLFLMIFYFLSGFFPRNQKVIVYGCPREGFSDNAKYAYLYDSCESNDGVSRYWVTSNKQLIDKFKNIENLKIVNRWSIKGVFIALTAGTYVYSSYVSDVNFWLSRKARLVNYWHGIPLKNIEFDINSGTLMRRYNPKSLSDKLISFFYYIYHPAVFKRPDLLCNPLPRFNEIFMRAFRVDEKAVFSDIYPRWRYILGDNSIDNVLVDELRYKEGLKEAKNLALYLPTFRDSDSGWINRYFVEHLEEIDKELVGQDTMLLVKLHPNENVKIEKIYKNICFVNSRLDIYPLLKHANIVITDYSSVMIDSVVCGKNVILYWPDFSDYNLNSRDSYFNLKSIFKNKPILSPDELKNFFKLGDFSERLVNKEIENEFIDKIYYDRKK